MFMLSTRFFFFFWQNYIENRNKSEYKDITWWHHVEEVEHGGEDDFNDYREQRQYNYNFIWFS